MQLKWSLSLGRVSGIKIFVHWTFIILIIWILVSSLQQGHSWGESLVAVMFLLTLFFCVVLHELGHALTARHYEIETRNITLLPIGGMASMERMPEKPGQELFVAIMGPAVNLVIGFVLFIYLYVTHGLLNAEELQTIQNEGVNLSHHFFYNLMVVNFVLVGFNMIPAFPMDGGRVLRALLSYKMDRAKATHVAARVGQFLAILFVLLGFFEHNYMLMFIGLFIFLGAGGEDSFEASRSLLEGYKVSDVVMHKFTIFQGHEPLQHAIDVMLDSQEKEFIVQENGDVTGVLSRNDIIKGLSEQGKQAPVRLVMNKDFNVLDPEMDLVDVYRTMNGSKQTLYPVMEGGILSGVLDQENLYELILLTKASGNKS